jgi:transcriptional regulator with XRE-family HTH domain
VTGTPPVRRRLLGAALRRYRENLGYGLDEAARILECDRSKISRIETGQRGIRAKELRELLAEYGVPDNEQAALLAIAHRGRQHGWWQDYQDVLSETGQDYVIMEAAASEILAYAAHQVPGLLQTREYARAVADADPNCTGDAQRAHAVEVKLARQRAVLADRGPRLEFVIAEGALHQVVGGSAVMRPQLARLAELAEAAAAGAGATAGRASVSLRVLPFAAGAYAAAGSGSMAVLRFADAPGLGVIHLAALSGGVSLEGQDEVARYIRAFDGLRAAALTPAASARLLRDMARD